MAKKLLKLPKAQMGKTVGNPYGKDFGAGLKNDVARKAYIKSDSLAKEGAYRKPTDAEWKNKKVSEVLKKQETNRKAADTYKKIGDEVRKTQGYPTREEEFKKGGSTKSKKKK